MKMKSKDFRKLSKEERKEFKSSGGKVSLSFGEKLFVAIVIFVGIGWLSGRHSPDSQEPLTAENKAQQAEDAAIKNAQRNCMLDATHHVQIPDSFKRTSEYATTPMTDKTGYVVSFKFTAKNKLGVDIPKRTICKTDNSGVLIKSTFM